MLLPVLREKHVNHAMTQAKPQSIKSFDNPWA
jgi:hypothetical protein